MCLGLWEAEMASRPGLRSLGPVRGDPVGRAVWGQGCAGAGGGCSSHQHRPGVCRSRCGQGDLLGRCLPESEGRGRGRALPREECALAAVSAGALCGPVSDRVTSGAHAAEHSENSVGAQLRLSDCVEGAVRDM